MILTADSGSTKTAWCVGELTFNTQGLNPLTTPDEAIALTLAEARSRVGGVSVSKVVFYGAGCATEPMRLKIAQHLGAVFPDAEVEVGTDMLGACRGFGSAYGAGLVGILGTGSNACYYDGTAILSQPHSLGYVLGDEGSGNHIGRCLLKEYLEERMPQPLASLFSAQFGITHPVAIEHIYRQPNANRWLASLAPFASANISDPYVSGLVEQCMAGYFDHIVSPLSRQAARQGLLHHDELRLVGSVAQAFAQQLSGVAARYHISITAIQKAPRFF